MKLTEVGVRSLESIDFEREVGADYNVGIALLGRSLVLENIDLFAFLGGVVRFNDLLAPLGEGP